MHLEVVQHKDEHFANASHLGTFAKATANLAVHDASILSQPCQLAPFRRQSRFLFGSHDALNFLFHDWARVVLLGEPVGVDVVDFLDSALHTS